MQKVIMLATGKEVEVTKNEAHTLIDKKLAVLKAFFKPRKNKMMSLKRKSVRKK